MKDKISPIVEIFSNFWQVPEGESIIRFLPRLESASPWLKISLMSSNYNYDNYIKPIYRYILNCYIVKDGKDSTNNGKIKLISVSEQIFNEIYKNINCEDKSSGIFDPENGFDFVINKTINGKYPDYSSSRFIFEKYKIDSMENIKDKLINIDSIDTEKLIAFLKK